MILAANAPKSLLQPSVLKIKPLLLTASLDLQLYNSLSSQGWIVACEDMVSCYSLHLDAIGNSGLNTAMLSPSLIHFQPNFEPQSSSQLPKVERKLPMCTARLSTRLITRHKKLAVHHSIYVLVCSNTGFCTPCRVKHPARTIAHW